MKLALLTLLVLAELYCCLYLIYLGEPIGLLMVLPIGMTISYTENTIDDELEQH